jgi:hypothetical protein
MESCRLPRIYVLGAPGPVGGADTELWHTLRLWRGRGLCVTVVPTWGISAEWRAKCEGIGCEVHVVQGPSHVLDVPGLRGSTVVSFCNGEFLKHAAVFRGAGCPVVWANCMTWMFDEERRHFGEFGTFAHFVFQSEYQREMLSTKYREFGYRDEQGTVVRGAFAVEEFPFRPLSHARGEPLVVGRISRPDVDKFSSNTWWIYQRVPYPLRARLMAWNERVEKKLGAPPSWAECLAANRETPQQFFSKLHVMVQVNGGAAENWPRSGLEAMAAGVPVVVQNQWGWREMVVHGETGYLCDTDEELAYYTAKLAYEEDRRLEMASLARRRLEQDLASPDRLWAAWHNVFAKAAAGQRSPASGSPS